MAYPPNVGNNNDYVNYSTVTILNNWDLFPAGTGNRQDAESNGGNGVNLWDYSWDSWSVGGTWGPWGDYGTLLYHQCTGDQAI
jgi:hypothetical protein